MKNILLGLVFALFSVNINFGICRVDFLPNFVGFYFILKGFRELHPVNSSIFEVFGYIKIAFIYSVFTFAFKLLGIFAMFGIVAVVFELIEVGLLIYIVYKLIDDLKKAEAEKGIYLRTKKLEQLWNINISCMVIFALSGILPQYPFVSIILSAVSFVVSAVFIYEFSKAKTAYDSAFME